MEATISIYSMKKEEIEKFLSSFCNRKIEISKNEWQCKYENPVEMAEIIGVFIDNKEKFKMNMWVCIDQDFSINITDANANKIIKYLYERFPY
ncbi:MAG: hypothetical protein IKP28_04825 [Clostridia bacterium]|nr:hypothetical protein [Clostridia bacterium]